MICGKGGIGKSTLINQLLKLGTDEQAAVGTSGELTTSGVTSYERVNELGVKICLYDTPGFGDPNVSNTDVIAMMQRATKKELDLVLYCIALAGTTRLEDSDVKAMKLLTEVFRADIWKKTMIVFTQANMLETHVESNIPPGDDCRKKYKSIIDTITKKAKEMLTNKAHVEHKIVADIPFVTAGYKEKVLKYEAQECPEGWEDRLFLKILERIDPKVLPAFFQVRWSWKDTVAALGGGGGGIAAGTATGAMVGAAMGVLGGPPGIALGAGIGAGAGAVIGAVGGTGTGVATSQLLKIKHILIIKYKNWRWRSNSQTRSAATEPKTETQGQGDVSEGTQTVPHEYETTVV